ncbi:MAG TPA: hypothetical protein VEZ42_04370 [Pseudonocardia sp.]|nr:hypothetical protein [Pseudonocardia sp.]
MVISSRRGFIPAWLRRAHFNNLTRWVETVRRPGTPGLHFHDLRHAGNHLAAQTGASTRELMARMGHDDMRAALIYQRATSEADRRIAAGTDVPMAHRGPTEWPTDGPQG